LDGHGKSRIFYGTNTTLSMDRIRFYNASLVLLNDTDDDDVIGMGGSALSFTRGSTIIVSDTFFSFNTAPMGGAIALENSVLLFRNRLGFSPLIRFFKNTATTDSGGAIYGLNSIFRTSRRGAIRFEHNHATTFGGAIDMIGGNVVIQNTIMARNTATNSVRTFVAKLCF
jgi:predicted outer membrane repeat protein